MRDFKCLELASCCLQTVSVTNSERQQLDNKCEDDCSLVVRSFWRGRDKLSEWFIRDIFSDILKFSVVKEMSPFLMSCRDFAARCCFQKIFSFILTLVSYFPLLVSFADHAWRHQSYLLTYCMVPSLYRESDILSDNKQIHPTLWNTNFHQCIHKILPTVKLLSQQNPFPDPHSWSCISL